MDNSVNRASSEELWRELAELRDRVEAIEAALRTAGAAPDAKHEPDTSPATPLHATHPRVNLAPVADAGRSGQPSALESRIGAQLFNRIGIFAVLAAAAWFLKLAIDRAWIGPGLRVIVGLLIAVALVLWSERFRRSGSVAFSYTLKGLASGIAYLSLWACFNLYHLLPSWLVFVGMAGVTVTNAVLAWRQDSEPLAALALAGGLATPALLSTGDDQELFLFSYLLLLDIGALVLVEFRPWPRMAIGAFAGTTMYFAFWSFRYYTSADESATGWFITLIWSDRVNLRNLWVCRCRFVGGFRGQSQQQSGQFKRRLISLIFAGRNRIILIRRELPLTVIASPAEPVA